LFLLLFVVGVVMLRCWLLVIYVVVPGDVVTLLLLICWYLRCCCCDLFPLLLLLLRCCWWLRCWFTFTLLLLRSRYVVDCCCCCCVVTRWFDLLRLIPVVEFVVDFTLLLLICYLRLIWFVTLLLLLIWCCDVDLFWRLHHTRCWFGYSPFDFTFTVAVHTVTLLPICYVTLGVICLLHLHVPRFTFTLFTLRWFHVVRWLWLRWDDSVPVWFGYGCVTIPGWLRLFPLRLRSRYVWFVVCLVRCWLRCGYVVVVTVVWFVPVCHGLLRCSGALTLRYVTVDLLRWFWFCYVYALIRLLLFIYVYVVLILNLPLLVCYGRCCYRCCSVTLDLVTDFTFTVYVYGCLFTFDLFVDLVCWFAFPRSRWRSLHTRCYGYVVRCYVYVYVRLRLRCTLIYVGPLLPHVTICYTLFVEYVTITLLRCCYVDSRSRWLICWFTRWCVDLPFTLGYVVTLRSRLLLLIYVGWFGCSRCRFTVALYVVCCYIYDLLLLHLRWFGVGCCPGLRYVYVGYTLVTRVYSLHVWFYRYVDYDLLFDLRCWLLRCSRLLIWLLLIPVTFHTFCCWLHSGYVWFPLFTVGFTHVVRLLRLRLLRLRYGYTFTRYILRLPTPRLDVYVGRCCLLLRYGWFTFPTVTFCSHVYTLLLRWFVDCDTRTVIYVVVGYVPGRYVVTLRYLTLRLLRCRLRLVTGVTFTLIPVAGYVTRYVPVVPTLILRLIALLDVYLRCWLLLLLLLLFVVPVVTVGCWCWLRYVYVVRLYWRCWLFTFVWFTFVVTLRLLLFPVCWFVTVTITFVTVRCPTRLRFTFYGCYVVVVTRCYGTLIVTRSPDVTIHVVDFVRYVVVVVTILPLRFYVLLLYVCCYVVVTVDVYDCYGCWFTRTRLFVAGLVTHRLLLRFGYVTLRLRLRLHFTRLICVALHFVPRYVYAFYAFGYGYAILILRLRCCWDYVYVTTVDFTLRLRFVTLLRCCYVYVLRSVPAFVCYVYVVGFTFDLLRWLHHTHSRLRFVAPLLLRLRLRWFTRWLRDLHITFTFTRYVDLTLRSTLFIPFTFVTIVDLFTVDLLIERWFVVVVVVDLFPRCPTLLLLLRCLLLLFTFVVTFVYGYVPVVVVGCWFTRLLVGYVYGCYVYGYVCCCWLRYGYVGLLRLPTVTHVYLHTVCPRCRLHTPHTFTLVGYVDSFPRSRLPVTVRLVTFPLRLHVCCVYVVTFTRLRLHLFCGLHVGPVVGGYLPLPTLLLLICYVALGVVDCLLLRCWCWFTFTFTFVVTLRLRYGYVTLRLIYDLRLRCCCCSTFIYDLLRLRFRCYVVVEFSCCCCCWFPRLLGRCCPRCYFGDLLRLLLLLFVVTLFVTLLICCCWLLFGYFVTLVVVRWLVIPLRCYVTLHVVDLLFTLLLLLLLRWCYRLLLTLIVRWLLLRLLRCWCWFPLRCWLRCCWFTLRCYTLFPFDLLIYVTFRFTRCCWIWLRWLGYVDCTLRYRCWLLRFDSIYVTLFIRCPSLILRYVYTFTLLLFGYTFDLRYRLWISVVGCTGYVTFTRTHVYVTRLLRCAFTFPFTLRLRSVTVVDLRYVWLRLLRCLIADVTVVRCYVAVTCYVYHVTLLHVVDYVEVTVVVVGHYVCCWLRLRFGCPTFPRWFTFVTLDVLLFDFVVEFTICCCYVGCCYPFVILRLLLIWLLLRFTFAFSRLRFAFTLHVYVDYRTTFTLRCIYVPHTYTVYTHVWFTVGYTHTHDLHIYRYVGYVYRLRSRCSFTHVYILHLRLVTVVGLVPVAVYVTFTVLHARGYVRFYVCVTFARLRLLVTFGCGYVCTFVRFRLLIYVTLRLLLLLFTLLLITLLLLLLLLLLLFTLFTLRLRFDLLFDLRYICCYVTLLLIYIWFVHFGVTILRCYVVDLLLVRCCYVDSLFTFDLIAIRCCCYVTLNGWRCCYVVVITLCVVVVDCRFPLLVIYITVYGYVVDLLICWLRCYVVVHILLLLIWLRWRCCWLHTTLRLLICCCCCCYVDLFTRLLFVGFWLPVTDLVYALLVDYRSARLRLRCLRVYVVTRLRLRCTFTFTIYVYVAVVTDVVGCRLRLFTLLLVALRCCWLICCCYGYHVDGYTPHVGLFALLLDCGLRCSCPVYIWIYTFRHVVAVILRWIRWFTIWLFGCWDVYTRLRSRLRLPHVYTHTRLHTRTYVYVYSYPVWFTFDSFVYTVAYTPLRCVYGYVGIYVYAGYGYVYAFGYHVPTRLFVTVRWLLRVHVCWRLRCWTVGCLVTFTLLRLRYTGCHHTGCCVYRLVGWLRLRCTFTRLRLIYVYDLLLRYGYVYVTPRFTCGLIVGYDFRYVLPVWLLRLRYVVHFVVGYRLILRLRSTFTFTLRCCLRCRFAFVTLPFTFTLLLVDLRLRLRWFTGWFALFDCYVTGCLLFVHVYDIYGYFVWLGVDLLIPVVGYVAVNVGYVDSRLRWFTFTLPRCCYSWFVGVNSPFDSLRCCCWLRCCSLLLRYVVDCCCCWCCWRYGDLFVPRLLLRCCLILRCWLLFPLLRYVWLVRYGPTFTVVTLTLRWRFTRVYVYTRCWWFTGRWFTLHGSLLRFVRCYTTVTLLPLRLLILRLRLILQFTFTDVWCSVYVYVCVYVCCSLLVVRYVYVYVTVAVYVVGWFTFTAFTLLRLVTLHTVDYGCWLAVAVDYTHGCYVYRLRWLRLGSYVYTHHTFTFVTFTRLHALLHVVTFGYGYGYHVYRLLHTPVTHAFYLRYTVCLRCYGYTRLRLFGYGYVTLLRCVAVTFVIHVLRSTLRLLRLLVTVTVTRCGCVSRAAGACATGRRTNARREDVRRCVHARWFSDHCHFGVVPWLYTFRAELHHCSLLPSIQPERTFGGALRRALSPSSPRHFSYAAFPRYLCWQGMVLV